MKQIIFITLLAVTAIIIGACSVQETTTGVNLPDASVIETKLEQTITQKSAVVINSFSESDLAEHNYKTDCWVGYDGFVYDVTQWFARETDRVEFKDREGSAALRQTEYDDAQSVLLRHCGTIVSFEKEFDRTAMTLKKSRAFVNPIGTIN